MKQPIPYKIGGKYKYPNFDQLFVLKWTNGFSFRFECGHWCTDNVFVNLIDVETDIQIYTIMPGRQLTLF